MKNTKYSRIIAGTMTWGSWGKSLDTKGIISLINYCLESGISTFDHADIYGGYTTEADFGKAFGQSRIAREDIQLISKCGIQLIAESRNNTLKHYNYSKDYIIWSAEQSLKNLKTDYLDLFLLHRPSPLMEVDAIAEAVTRLKSSGKIKDFGVSNFTVSQMELLRTQIPIDTNQIEFSLTQHDAMDNGLLDYMTTNKIQPMAWSPLGTVFREDTEQTRRIHRQLGLLMEKYNATEDQLLLAWIFRHPAGVLPVIGSSNPKRMVNAIAAADINLELQDWFSILEASQGHEVP